MADNRDQHRKPVIRALVALSGETLVCPSGLLVAGFVLPTRLQIATSKNMKEESKAKHDAMESFVKDNPLASFWMGIGALCIVFFFIISLGNPSPAPATQSPQNNTVTAPAQLTQSRSASIGEEGVLAAPSDEIVVTTTEEAFEKYADAIFAKDVQGAAELITNDEAFFVDNGTKVLVIDKKFASTRVRLLDGAEAGRSGWVHVEYVTR